MIDEKQLRAARALLDWSQERLAQVSGVARATIKNIENRMSLPRRESADAIRSALERAGVEFLPRSGVRLRDNIIETFEGADATRALVEDIYETLRDTGGEILIAFLNEEKGIQDLGFDYLEEQGEKRRNAGITHRLLIRRKESYIVGPLDSYRTMPDEYFSPHPFFIYGPKLALLRTEPVARAVILNDVAFAESARNLFDFIWDRTEMPSTKNKTSIMAPEAEVA
jgi:transcriptional regulator with XRE-family HTH domain